MIVGLAGPAVTANWTVLSGNGKTPHELKADNLRARIAAQEGTTR